MATIYYRTTITDPVTRQPVKLNFPLEGNAKDRRARIKEIKHCIYEYKLEAKKLEAKALIFEAEALRNKLHEHESRMIARIAISQNADRTCPLGSLFSRYKLTSHYAKLSAGGKYQREKHFAKLVDFMAKRRIADAAQISHDNAVEFMLSLNGSAATFNKYITNYAGIFKALGLDNPFAGVSRRNAEADAKVKKPFTQTEIDAILNTFTGDWREICLIAAYTGMRFGDVIHLNNSNIVLDFHKQRHIIKLTPAKTSHTGRSLYIELLPPLQYLIDKETDKNGFFFPDMVSKYKAGTQHAGKSLNHVFNKKLKAKPLEITGKSFHCFRHFFVDKLRKAGLSNDEIGSVIGHSSTAQTRDYGDFHNPVNLSKVLESS